MLILDRLKEDCQEFIAGFCGAGFSLFNLLLVIFFGMLVGVHIFGWINPEVWQSPHSAVLVVMHSIMLLMLIAMKPFL